MPMDLREQKFGIEIELTGLTRKRAAEVIGKYLGQEPHYDGGYGRSCMTPVLLQ